MSETTPQPLPKTTLHKRLALLVLALGLGLMAMKIHADSEPGLIPLVMVVLGITWFIVARVRGRSRPG